MIDHVVLLKPKPGIDGPKLTALWSGLGALKTRIPGIVSIHMGENTSPEGKDKGFTLGFIVTFETAEHRDAYLPHPDHIAVVPLVRVIADDVLVFDFKR
jgi:hypothetical protein